MSPNTTLPTDHSQLPRGGGSGRFCRLSAALYALGLAVLAPACVAEDIDMDEPLVAAADRELAGDGASTGAGRAASTVYSSIRREDAQGRVTHATVEGELTEQVAQRAGRPWTYLHEHEIYDDEAWASSDDQGNVEYGYRVTRSVNPAPARRPIEMGPPELDAQLEQALTQVRGDTRLPVFVRIRNFPQWDIPLRPEAMQMSAQELVAASERREGALRARAELADSMSADVIEQISALGGEVTGKGRYSAWVAAEVPAAAIAALGKRQDLASIALLQGESVTHSWRLGELRQGNRIDADRFLDAGYTGERSNPERHGHNDIVVAVIEPDLLEDEGCFLYDGTSCSGPSRLIYSSRCDDADNDGNYCEPVASFADNDSNASHGTAVASTILADYRQGQGDDYALGDGAWTAETGHSTTWKNRATGIAPEASLIFFGQMPTNVSSSIKSLGFADAFDDAIDYSVDITNSSWAWDTSGGSICSRTATQPFELELQNAFDDGILNVVSAGNDNDPTDASVSCNMRSPADVPKALTVNAVNGNDVACEGDYNACVLDTNYSSTGGIDAKINGSLYADTVSGVDLVAPNWNRYVTWPTGGRGEVGGSFVGTSAAAPVVAGAAVLVKDWQLAVGNTWINLPGRLHTMMLAMTDRHRAGWKGTSTSQGTYGSDRLWGLGKLKLRLFQSGQGMGAWAYHMRTKSFSSASSDHVYFPFSGPIPAGATMVKCVLMQDEDMSSKDDISRIDLLMRFRLPVSGQCSSAGTLTAARYDRRKDTKKMGAVEDSHATIAGRCLEVTLDKQHVTASGITTHTMCYYASKDDDQ